MGEMRNAYKIFAGKPEKNRPLGRPRHRLEGNMKMDLRATGMDDEDWIHLALNRDQ
jgi:hypothetical protein